MYAKMQLTGTLEVMTGMHIGGSEAFSAIGAVDAPVIKDALTGDPMIPGSSLKGKLRSLVARQYNERVNAEPDDDAERITRLFGCAKKGKAKRSKLLFFDLFLSNRKELREHGVDNVVEIKFENRIQRLTSVADPRQIERIVRGAKFDLDLIYEADYDDGEEEKIVEDIETLCVGMRLLQYDYLGGSGSRGYGRVRFQDLCLDVVLGEVSEELLEACQEKVEEV